MNIKPDLSRENSELAYQGVIFNPVDPLLEPTKKLLTGMGKERATPILHLFQAKISDHKGEVVAVRSQDIVTILHELAEGQIVFNSGNNTIMDKGDSAHVLFTTPHYANSYFLKHPELAGPTTPLPLLIEQSTSLYAQIIAFSTAISRIIVPLLQEEWIDKTKTMLRESNPELYRGMSADSWATFTPFEELSEILLERCRKINERGPDSITLLKRNFPSNLLKFLDLIHFNESMSQNGKFNTKLNVLNFLLDAEKQRGGVIIAFNENVLKNRTIATDTHDPDNLLHSSPELGIVSEDGKLSVTPDMISAIEPLGDYEVDILSQFTIEN